MSSPRGVGVFFSHNAADKDDLKRLAARLRDGWDIRCWLDQYELPSGKLWEPAIEQALHSCSACAIFLGASGWGEYHLREARFLIDRASTQNEFVAIPVLLRGATDEAIAQAGDFFRAHQRVSFEKGIDDDDAFHALRTAIVGESQGPPGMSLFSVGRDAQQWERSARDRSALYRGRQLQLAQEMVAADSNDLDEITVRFLTASGAEEQRAIRSERKRDRIVLTMLSVLLLAALAAAYIAVGKAREADDGEVFANFERTQAEIHQLTAQRQRAAAQEKQREAERQTRRALAAGLIESAQQMYETSPLSAAGLAVEALHQASGVDPELTKRASIAMNVMTRNGRLLKIGKGYPQPLLIENTPFFILNGNEVRRIDDASLMAKLPGFAKSAVVAASSSDASPTRALPLIHVEYRDHAPELRRLSDLAPMHVAGTIEKLKYKSGDPFFIVNYEDAPAELWRSSPPHEVIQLTGRRAHIPDADIAPLFLIDYDGNRSELRRRDSGAVVQTLNRSMASIQGVNHDRSVFTVKYLFGPPGYSALELRKTSDGTLVGLPGEPTLIQFDPRSNRYLVDYADLAAEIRRTDSDAVVKLTDHVREATFHEAAFVVDYVEAKDEIRTADGASVRMILERELVRSQFFESGKKIGLQLGGRELALRAQIFSVEAGLLEDVESLHFSQPFVLIKRAGAENIEVIEIDSNTRFSVPGLSTITAAIEGTPYVLFSDDSGGGTLYRRDRQKIIPIPGTKRRSYNFQQAAADGENAIVGGLMIRKLDDRITELPGEPSLYGVIFSSDSRTIAIHYNGSLSPELRRASGELIVKLPEKTFRLEFIEDGRTFVLQFEQRAEWRSSSDGRIITTGSKITLLPNQKSVLVSKDAGTAELWHADGTMPRRILTLGQQPGAVFVNDTSTRAIVWDDEGDAYVVDLMWPQTAGDDSTNEREICRRLPEFDRIVSPHLAGMSSIGCAIR